MNYVNLIGQMCSEPKYLTLENGKKIARFNICTKEHYLDAAGNSMVRKDYHLLCAWGKWLSVVKTIQNFNSYIAIEGKIMSRFYVDKGQKKHISEIEINDLLFIENEKFTQRNMA
ncbi:MAG: single-stranded DNA-binding protein [Crocinitomicaceae bacterium]|nr:single-stranded DNA-binding protein [Crocinitomicaceae bacterium]|tara:strand:- start:29 stop:373 length:345 start_codon:yes stop_codon:yes gene_type:complete